MKKNLAHRASSQKHKVSRRKSQRAAQLRSRKRKIERRLKVAARMTDRGKPVFGTGAVKYELSKRSLATNHGAVAIAYRVAVRSGLVSKIDDALELLKVHQPYHESDHVLNIAMNALCGGRTLDDIEHRRNDTAFLNSLGARAIPDPTTAGDFCRRFAEEDIEVLMDAINDARLNVWARQPELTAGMAIIDGDGSLITTTGECKEGMGLSYKGTWGYHPLLISLANTNEPLFIVNRSGGRPSSEGAAKYFNKAITLCRAGGFKEVLLRGDTDFSQTTHLDRWDREHVQFVFGYKAVVGLKTRAGSLNDDGYNRLVREAERTFLAKEARARQPRVKEQIVKDKGYTNITLNSEDVAEFEYTPGKCDHSYRMIVLRKNLSIEKGENVLFDDVRYFFYITNTAMDPDDVVRESNQRCNQENLIGQLKGGVRALHAPVNTLNANWAYMVMCALAWTLKAWMALWLPVHPRWADKHRQERDAWLRMEYRTFLNAVINIPAQIVTTGRAHVFRLLAWRPQLPVLFRLLDAL